MLGLFRRLRALFTHAAPPKKPAPRAARLERLEDRLVPTTVLSPGCTCPNCTGGARPANASNPTTNVLGDWKWDQPNGLGSAVTITYSYHSSLVNGAIASRLGVTKLKLAIEEALRTWASVTPLRFVEVNDAGPAPGYDEYEPAGLPMMRFGALGMGGAGGTIGLGWMPGGTGLSGDVWFDPAEAWRIGGTGNGPDFLECAVHEIGHGLGLEHVDNVGAIMNSMLANRYDGLGTSYLLGSDVNSISTLYGTGTGSVTPKLPPGLTTQTFFPYGNTLYVQGAAGNDTLTYNSTTGKVTVNALTYSGSLASFTQIIFSGNGGFDTFRATGTAGVDTIDVSPVQTTITSGGFGVLARTVEKIEVTASANDTAKIAGTTGNDTAWLWAGTARLLVAGYDANVTAGTVTVTGSSGYDRAYLYGSAAGDSLVANFAQSVLYVAGKKRAAVGFEAVEVQASAGSDSASFYGGTANETLVVAPAWAKMANAAGTVWVLAKAFENVTGYAGGGTDAATIYGTSGVDSFNSDRGNHILQGANHRVTVFGYRSAVVYGNGGADQAAVGGTAGNDTFSAAANYATLSMPVGWVRVVNFATVWAFNEYGGTDRKQLSARTFATYFDGVWI